MKDAIQLSFKIPCLKREVIKSSFKVQWQVTNTTVAGASDQRKDLDKSIKRES